MLFFFIILVYIVHAHELPSDYRIQNFLIALFSRSAELSSQLKHDVEM